MKSLLSGFTLVEVLVAMVICLVALTVATDVIVAAQTSVKKGNYYNLASKAAADQISVCEAAGYSSLTNSTTTSSISSLPNGSMSVTIGPLDGNSSNTHIKQIDIVVTWSVSSGPSNLGGQVKMSTLISDS